MKDSFRLILLGALTAMWAILPGAWAQETPPAPAVESPAVVEPAQPVASETKADEGDLRRLDVATPKADAPAIVPATPEPDAKPAPKVKRKRSKTYNDGTPKPRDGDEQVSIRGDIHIEEGRIVNDGVVTVLGDVRVDGAVKDDVVAVLGSVTINGTVAGEVVAVMGDVTLGPKAHVDGQIVSVGGQVIRAPGAFVGGQIVNQHMMVSDGLNAWLHHAVRYGRPLAIGAHLGWLWFSTAAVLALYALMALVMPRQMINCGEALVQRPVAVVVSALLTMIALPLLWLLLTVIVIGIPISFVVLPITVLLCVLFGKASIYCLVGRAVSRGQLHPALAVLVGAIPFILLYFVPVLGFLVWVFVSFVGFGCSVVSILSSRKKATMSADPVILPVTPMPTATAPLGAQSVPFATTAGTVEQAASAVPPLVPPVVVPVPPLVTSAVRAGFWPRTGAMFIDLIIVAVIFGAVGGNGSVILTALAIYAALFWKFRGTTLGGIVCGLQVVRLDGREIDWPTAVVRALGCFVSLFVGGLGFVWVAFDPEKQSWHDKIAGTVVVRAPKGKSLV